MAPQVDGLGFDTESPDITKQPTIQELLTFPVFWNNVKCLDFLLAAHNYFKESQIDSKAFEAELDSEAKSHRWLLWGNKTNWKQVLGEEHFNLLILHFKREPVKDNKGNVIGSRLKSTPGKLSSTSSVLELIRLIRNRFEHNAFFSPDQKEILGYYQISNGEYQIDKTLYMHYWTSRYPNLLLFLWVKFQHLVGLPTFKPFYPIQIENCCHKIQQIPGQILASLQNHLESGGLEHRTISKLKDTQIALEVRQLQPETVNYVLNGNSAVEICNSINGIKTKWYSVNDTEVPIPSDEIIIQIMQNCTLEPITMLIGNRIRDIILLKSRVIELIQAESENHLRIILFASEKYSQIENEIVEFLKQVCNECGTTPPQEKPVFWTELSESARLSIENKSKVTYQFDQNNRVIKLNSILPNECSVRDKLLSNLQGSLLNDLLKANKPVIFAKHELPTPPQIYLKRRLFKNVYLSPDVLNTNLSAEDILMITGIDENTLKRITTKEITKIFLQTNEPWDRHITENAQSKIFLLGSVHKDQFTILRGVIRDYVKGIPGINMHLFQFLQPNKVQWLYTEGTTNSLQELVPNFASHIQRTTEEEFFIKMETLWTNNRLVLFSDRPGMGKTFVINNLARKIRNEFSNRLVVFVSVNEFLEKIGLNLTYNYATVSNILIQMLASNCFEEALLRHWLQTDQHYMEKFKLELFLDGLDEVKRSNRHLGIQLLQCFVQESTSVRVWVTFRHHMLQEIQLRDNLQFSVHKFEPFSEEEQISFLVQYWSQGFSEEEDNPSTAELQEFAKICRKVKVTREESDISGIPLQCRMIAEIYEKQVLAKNFNLEESKVLSLTDLYRNLIDRRLETFLVEKKKFPENISVTDPLITILKEQLELFHVYYALKLIISDEIAEKFKSKLLISTAFAANSNCLVLAQGIIETLEPFIKFLHRTFAEYILAEFAVKVLTQQFLHIKENSDAFQQLLWQEIISEPCNEDVECLIIGILIIRYDLKFPTMLYFFNTLLGNYRATLNLELPEAFSRLLNKLVHYGANYDERTREKVSTFYALRHRNLDNVYTLLLRNPKHVANLVIAGLLLTEFESCLDVIEKYFSPKYWHLLQKSDSRKNGMLHWIVWGISAEHGRFPESIQEVDKIISYVLEKDSTLLEQIDRKGRTPILYFIQKVLYVFSDFYLITDSCMYETLYEKLLLEFRANISVIDKFGNTVLHVMKRKLLNWEPERKLYFLKAFLKVWEFFLKHECQKYVNHFNEDGDTPLLSASPLFVPTNPNKYIRKTFKVFHRYGADFNAKDKDGNTILHSTIENGLDASVMADLLEFGAIPGVANNKAQNALHIAVKMQNFEVIELLLHKYKTDLDTLDSEEKLPSSYDGWKDYVKRGVLKEKYQKVILMQLLRHKLCQRKGS